MGLRKHLTSTTNLAPDDAHLTGVLLPLAISRHLDASTGFSIKRIVQILRTARSATVEINGQQLSLEPTIPDDAAALLRAIGVTKPSG